jgi:hypothetical protein
MTGPDEEASADRGHLRAAHADREHVIAVLKAAFVQGRLTKDELEARVSQALASKTYAELATLTADIPASPADLLAVPPGLLAVPAGLPGTGPADPRSASTPARTLGRAARRSGTCLLIMVALVEAAFLTHNPSFLVLAVFAFIAVSGFLGYGIVDARQESRSRAELPSGPGHDGPGHHDSRPGRADLNQPPASPRTDPTRTDRTRTDRTRADRTRTDRTRADYTRTDRTRTDYSRTDRTRSEPRAVRSAPGPRSPSRRCAPVPAGI